MRLLVCLSAVAVLGVSCEKEQEPNQTGLIGSWRLAEIYSDPGDGSGDFVAVDSDKRITLEADSTVSSNGSLCRSSTATDSPSRGTYFTNASRVALRIEDCPEYSPSLYTWTDSELIVSYPCYEACQEKYVRE